MTATKIIVIALIAILAGCADGPMIDTVEADQCLRAKLFKECMAILPAGPTATMYNDWAEVVSECGSQAYYQSLRKQSAITKECGA